ncbi:MAG: beta-ketoacyl synthase [Flavobacteriaceae bacterium]|nr:beta-ketoacyl synthase [Flavobacteriaceae bacterium]
MREVYITDHHIISPLGFDSASNFRNLLASNSGIKEYQRENGQNYFTSLIDKKKIDKEFAVIENIRDYTILEKMMILSVYHLLKESDFSITNRTGLLISTTKGNIDLLADDSNFKKDKKRVYLSELAKQIQNYFGFKNKAIVLSNACVSGILAVSVADRLIKSELYDDVIIVSGDLVTEFILSGFTSFQAISDQPCKPFSKNRSGITIGEAIASIIVSSDKNRSKRAVQILGSGSCNDANHISGPSRTGEGLYLSVKSALEEAQISVKEIDYISAHGTATNFNDEMESIAFSRLNMLDIPLNSLKGFYGHTLGASGLLETIIGIESLHENMLIASKGFDEIGVTHPVNIIKENKEKDLHIFLKTASGFGGSNTAVIFRKV